MTMLVKQVHRSGTPRQQIVPIGNFTPHMYFGPYIDEYIFKRDYYLPIGKKYRFFNI